MRIVLAAVAGLIVLFLSMLVSGVVLGLLGKTDFGAWVLLSACLSGVVAAEAVKRVAPRAGRGRAILFTCVAVALFLIISLLDHWNQYGRVAWGSVLLEGAILVGLFGSWARWTEDEERLARAYQHARRRRSDA